MDKKRYFMIVMLLAFLPYISFFVVSFLQGSYQGVETWPEYFLPANLITEFVFGAVAVYLAILTEWIGAIAKAIEAIKNGKPVDANQSAAIRKTEIAAFWSRLMASCLAFLCFIIYFIQSLDDKGFMVLESQFDDKFYRQFMFYIVISCVGFSYMAFVTILAEKRRAARAR
jgi:uncharacterized BrkB/YihY/UPF0761 family membrane protein